MQINSIKIDHFSSKLHAHAHINTHMHKHNTHTHVCFLHALSRLFTLIPLTPNFPFSNHLHNAHTPTDKSRNGTGNGESGGVPPPPPLPTNPDQGPIPVTGVANSSVSSLSVPSSGPSSGNLMHGSSSATTLVVSATTFVRKSSLMRRPKTEVWTIDKEYSL